MLTFIAFRLMVGLGTLFILVSIWAFLKRKDPQQSPHLLGILPWLIPLPYLAIQAGWAVAEVGRQPWIVWGLMRTRDAVSPLEPTQVALSLTAFIVVYGLLGLAAFYLIIKNARKGPQASASGQA
jgi:cytochrome d ubiquinol oxidase subunit I